MNKKVKIHPHHIVGFSITICVLILWASGVVAFKIKEQEWMTLKIYTAGKIHKVIGYAFIFLGFFACGTGMIEFQHNYGTEELRWYGAANLYITILVYVVSECCHRRRRNSKDVFLAPDKFMTIKEFEEKIQKGEKLWILDNIILDLSEYADSHPGG